MAKKTPMHFLIDKLREKRDLSTGDRSDAFNTAIKMAVEMLPSEREELRDAWGCGSYDGSVLGADHFLEITYKPFEL